MSIIVRFTDSISGGSIDLVVPYRHQDCVLLAKHITCVVSARKYGKNYIKLLEHDRKEKQKQLKTGK